MPGNHIKVKVTCADIPVIMEKIMGLGYTISDIQYLDSFSFRFIIHRGSYNHISKVLRKFGAKIETDNTIGSETFKKKIKHRYILIISIIVVCVLSIFLPTRILFIEVEGNTAIPSALITEKAAECGITFGSSRSIVRSEKVKNDLISMIPNIQWVGINTRGCVATITIEEKTVEENTSILYPISNVIAERDGVILSYVVKNGNLLCTIGQAVKKGQVLVSGYTDTGLLIKAKNAEAEIYGLTNHTVNAVTPTQYQYRATLENKNNYYSIQIGKKLIKLYKGSGISDRRCVRMYEQRYITLPGNFALPISFITEKILSYNLIERQKESDVIINLIKSSAEEYILAQTIAGSILSSQTDIDETDMRCVLKAQYNCLEMIGRNKAEEYTLNYG